MMAEEEKSAESTRTSSIGQFLRTLSPDIRSLVRTQEKNYIKRSRRSLSVIFNNICLNEKLLPKYTKEKYIYIYIYK